MSTDDMSMDELIIDLTEHDGWFKDGAVGRRQFAAAFLDIFKNGAEMVPIVHKGKTLALAVSPELTKEMMISRIIERLRADDRLLVKVFTQVEKG